MMSGGSATVPEGGAIEEEGGPTTPLYPLPSNRGEYL